MIIDAERPTKKAEQGKTKRKAPPAKSAPQAAKRLTKISKNGASAKAYVVIDYPQNGDKIQSHHHYAIRIGASGGEKVEISIDGAPWSACRPSAGYFWHDWWNISKGSHKISARLTTSDGKLKKSKIVRCQAE